jgi:dephospho-CoA kinase
MIHAPILADPSLVDTPGRVNKRRVGENHGVTKRVGLTGGVASGKSTVSAMLADLGAVVIDADLLAREVVAPGTVGLAEVVTAFGSDVLMPDGQLDRPAVGALVFADEEKRRILEAIIHPLVRARGAEMEAQAPADAVVVHDIPLLAETGQADRFDAVIVVDVPVDLQLERMVRLRGMHPVDADARIAAQAEREHRLAIATHVIENTGTVDELRARVAEVYAELLEHAD